jgi:PadR family transcriptional regulator, regulatory protein PadR
LSYKVEQFDKVDEAARRPVTPMTNQDRLYLGVFEEAVLLAVFHLRDNAYGVPIRRHLEEVTGRSTSIGSVYTTLERLEQKGYVSSRQGEATPERGGRAKRYFKIEGAGVVALNETRAMRAKSWAGVTSLPDPGGLPA